MIEKALKLYDEMQQELSNCKKNENEFECRFAIANRYWAILQADLIHYSFDTIADEIVFFKTVKPLFIAELLYCGLCSYAQLCLLNVNEGYETAKFWSQELRRLDKFKEEHLDFVEYYLTQQTSLDEQWFTRKNNDNKYLFISTAFDLEHKASSSHDVLVSNLLALQRYIKYATTQMAVYKKTT